MQKATDILNALNGRRFTARQAMRACALTAHQVTAITAKSELFLFSDTLGQGRTRWFCLIDLYQMALYAMLCTMTGRPSWAAPVLNNMAFGGRYIDDREGIKDTDLVCDDIFQAPSYYGHRDLASPRVLLAGRRAFLGDIPDFRIGELEEFDFLTDVELMAGLFVNITAYLSGIDQILHEQLGEETDPHLTRPVHAATKVSS